MSHPSRAPQRFELPRILLKILVALFSGGIAFLFTALATSKNQEDGLLWELIIAIFIGGVVLVVQFIMEFDDQVRAMQARQTEHHRHLDRLVQRKFSQVNEATELFSLVEASALSSELILQFVRYAAEIRRSSSPIIHKFAEGEINRMSGFLKGLRDGDTVSYPGEDQDWLLTLTQNVQRSLDATSLSTVDAGATGFDGGFWRTDPGQRYLDLQKECVDRGIQIRRVFIIDRSELAEDLHFLEMYRLQKEAGIQVKMLDPTAAVVAGIRRSAMLDFILFDGEISYEMTPAARLSEDEHPTIVHTRLVLHEQQIKERIRNFNMLWAAAREIDLRNEHDETAPGHRA